MSVNFVDAVVMQPRLETHCFLNKTFLDAKTHVDASLSLSSVEWEVPRELVLHRSKVIPVLYYNIL